MRTILSRNTCVFKPLILRYTGGIPIPMIFSLRHSNGSVAIHTIHCNAIVSYTVTVPLYQGHCAVSPVWSGNGVARLGVCFIQGGINALVFCSSHLKHTLNIFHVLLWALSRLLEIWAVHLSISPVCLGLSNRGGKKKYLEKKKDSD